MANGHGVEHRELVMGKLSHGADLIEELTMICVERGIRLGRVEALGAVQSARLGFYDQAARRYEFIALDRPLEILNLTGNISLKDGIPFVHAHVTLGDSAGQAFGGHLAPGTTVFACEWIMEVLEGPRFEREFDQETGLPLWKLGDS